MLTIHEKLGKTYNPQGRVLIDAHHHLWNLDINHHPWLSNYDPTTFMGDYRSIMRNYLPENYLEDCKDFRVLATVHCEADHDYNEEVKETRWVNEQAEYAGFPNAIIGHIWFHTPNSEDSLKKQLEFSRLRGIRSKPVTAPTPELMGAVYGTSGSMQDKNWLNGFALLEKYNLSWDLRVPFWHLKEAANVASIFPKTQIILNHMGFPWDRSERGLQMWREGMQALAQCPNVSIKISELALRDQPWTVETNRDVVLEAISMFGMKRCLFASNFPVAGLKISYKDLVNNLAEIIKDFSEEEKEDFFWRNAKDFYRINL